MNIMKKILRYYSPITDHLVCRSMWSVSFEDPLTKSSNPKHI